MAALSFAFPVLAVEFFASRAFEFKNHGLKKSAVLGFVLRMLFLLAMGFAVFYYPVSVRDLPDTYAPLVWRFHEVVKICWLASPAAAFCALAFLVFAYWKLTFQKRNFRFTTTLFLPAAVTAWLFSLIYFNPSDVLHSLKKERAPGFERVFPAAGEKTGGAFFPHDLYVSPGDEWAAVSMGSTFGRRKTEKINFVWIDLKSGRSEIFRGSQVRRFYTECPRTLYFAPWHSSFLVKYSPGKENQEVIPLPQTLNGFPVRELFAVYNDCDSGLVYAASNVNPGIFVYDVRAGKLKETVNLAGMGGLWPSTHVFAVKPHDGRKSLFLSLYSEYSLVEIGLDDFEIKNKTARVWDLRNAFFDFAFSPDGKHVYAPSVFRGILFKFDADTLREEKRIKAPPHCRSLCFSKDGKYLFLASYLTGEILIYDAETDEKVLSLYVTPRAEAVFATQDYLYVAGSGGLFRAEIRDILKIGR